MIYTTGAINGTGYVLPCEALDITPVLTGVRVATTLVLYVVFCVLMFVYLSFFKPGLC